MIGTSEIILVFQLKKIYIIYYIYVKQGCSLSPMLFALYISGLGEALHLSKLGNKASIISALFFADDLVLISSDWHE